jgi:uncharacterized protein (TIGR02145 family)
VGISQVIVVGYLGTATDTCEFSVTVTRACPTTIPDKEGHVYAVAKLKGLCWTSNLQATKYDDDMPIPFAKPYNSSAYPATISSINTFGLLYTWDSAVGSDVETGHAPSLPTPIQGICPEDFHIPSVAEWSLLRPIPAPHLKSALYWSDPGLDSYHFDARPAGLYNGTAQRFENLYTFTGWWAADDNVADNSFANYFFLTYYCNTFLQDVMKKNYGLSVRCVMDY